MIFFYMPILNLLRRAGSAVKNCMNRITDPKTHRRWSATLNRSSKTMLYYHTKQEKKQFKRQRKAKTC